MYNVAIELTLNSSYKIASAFISSASQLSTRSTLHFEMRHLLFTLLFLDLPDLKDSCTKPPGQSGAAVVKGKGKSSCQGIKLSIPLSICGPSYLLQK